MKAWLLLVWLQGWVTIPGIATELECNRLAQTMTLAIGGGRVIHKCIEYQVVVIL